MWWIVNHYLAIGHNIYHCLRADEELSNKPCSTAELIVLWLIYGGILLQTRIRLPVKDNLVVLIARYQLSKAELV